MIMGALKLVKATHPLLKKHIKQVETFDQQLKDYLADLEDTLYQEGGQAIAAPQVGIDQQIAIVDMGPDGLLQLINPDIVATSDETQEDVEGSISQPDVFGIVERPQMIKVKSFDVNGREVELTAYDDIARMILHVCDHFNGILFTDKMKREITEEELEALLEDE